MKTKRGRGWLGAWVLGAVVLGVLSQPASAADIQKVFVSWTEGGQSQDNIISAGGDVHIYRDPGTTVSIRLYKDPGLGTVTYYCGASPGGTQSETTSASYSRWFTHTPTSGYAAVTCWVNTSTGKIDLVIHDKDQPKPDMEIESWSVDGSSSANGRVFYVGETVDLWCRVRNSGDGDAPFSYVGYYLGTSSTSTSNLIDDDPAGAIDSGDYSNEGTDYTFTASDRGSGKYFVFKADSDNDVGEEDEGNNLASWGPFTVADPPDPDLIISALTPTAEQQIDINDSITITCTVKNQGNGDADKTSALRLYQSTAPGDHGILLGSDITIDALADGEQQTKTINATFATAGTFYLFARADRANTVDEGSNENNNWSDDTLSPGYVKVVVASPYYHDLTPTALAPAKTEVQPGETLAVGFTVQNAGNSPTACGIFGNSIRWSTDSTITTTDPQLGLENLNGIAGGANASGSVDVTIPADAAPGTYYLGVLANFEGLVDEQGRTGNNTRAVAMTVPLTDADGRMDCFALLIGSGAFSGAPAPDIEAVVARNTAAFEEALLPGVRQSKAHLSPLANRRSARRAGS